MSGDERDARIERLQERLDSALETAGFYRELLETILKQAEHEVRVPVHMRITIQQVRDRLARGK